MAAKDIQAVVEQAEGLSLDEPGFSRQAVLALSRRKDEPEWVRQRRLEAWEVFEALPMPQWRR